LLGIIARNNIELGSRSHREYWVLRRNDLFVIESQQDIAGLNPGERRGAAIVNILEYPSRSEGGFIREIGCAGSVANIPESLFQHRGINQLMVQKPVLR
jgi:hypothetical protein